MSRRGGDDKGGAVTGGSPATRSRSGGALRVGVAGGGPKDSIDAHLQTTDPDIARAFQLYEPLAIRNADYELEMVLAESIEADKPDTWTVRLREGLTFHDGRPATATIYGDNYLKWRFAQDFWFTRPYLPQVSEGSLKNSPFNETQWDDPEFVKLIERARAELDDRKRADLLHQAQAIEHERGGYIVWSFSNQIDAHSSQVTGFAPARSGVPLTNYGLRAVGFAG